MWRFSDKSNALQEHDRREACQKINRYWPRLAKTVLQMYRRHNVMVMEEDGLWECILLHGGSTQVCVWGTLTHCMMGAEATMVMALLLGTSSLVRLAEVFDNDRKEMWHMRGVEKGIWAGMRG